MTKYRQKDNEAVIKVTNDVEVSFFDSEMKRFTNDMLNYSAGNSKSISTTLNTQMNTSVRSPSHSSRPHQIDRLMIQVIKDFHISIFIVFEGGAGGAQAKKGGKKKGGK